MNAQTTFLDVQKSATGRRWVERMTPAERNVALDIAQTHTIGDTLARVLAGRGVVTADVEAFLNPTLKALMPDPHSVTDLQKAAGRIVQAITRRERIAIFGDYDVDGASASALMKRYLRHFGLEPEIYIPDRIFEGYGPNPQAISDLASRHDLIVTVDCGTNSAEAFAAAAGSSCDIVVLDHHQVGGALPDVVACVNPNREDDLSGLGYLCAAGVVFMTLVDVSRQLRDAGRGAGPDLMALLDIVALATVCDVVPLTGLNRAFVVRGLLEARKQKNAGLAALATVAGIGEPLSTYHFGFVLGPRINAGGRIGDAALGSKLLVEDDPNIASDIARELDRLNAERQAIEAEMVAEARAEAEKELASANPPAILVTASERWHPGIAGLIASRVKDASRRPTFAIALDGKGKGTGSARSIPGFDIGKTVRAAVEAGLLIKGGGHAMAAGITVERAKLGALRAFFEERAGEAVAKLVETEVVKIDGALSARGVTPEMIASLESAGPYGTGNSTPVFVLPGHQVDDVRVVGNGHIKLRLRSPDRATIDAIGFRMEETDLGRFLLKSFGQTIHLAGTLSINHWQGREIPQMRIIDAAKAP